MEDFENIEDSAGDQTVEFLPFHAINEFMRNDFRLNVVKTTLNQLAALPEEYRQPLEKLIKEQVKVPGFRNSSKAPAFMKALPTAKAFEKSHELAAAIISAWVEAHPELRQQVYDLLISRDWEILPPQADRTQLPGFMTVWPKGENFETLYEAYGEAYPEAGASIDNMALMAVWLTNRLPYRIEGQEEDGEDEPDEGEAAGEGRETGEEDSQPS